MERGGPRAQAEKSHHERTEDARSWTSGKAEEELFPK